MLKMLFRLHWCAMAHEGLIRKEAVWRKEKYYFDIFLGISIQLGIVCALYDKVTGNS
jgi:hypothetical protein